jgi:hypothetical protein
MPCVCGRWSHGGHVFVTAVGACLLSSIAALKARGVQSSAERWWTGRCRVIQYLLLDTTVNIHGVAHRHSAGVSHLEATAQEASRRISCSPCRYRRMVRFWLSSSIPARSLVIVAGALIQRRKVPVIWRWRGWQLQGRRARGRRGAQWWELSSNDEVCCCYCCYWRKQEGALETHGVVRVVD